MTRNNKLKLVAAIIVSSILAIILIVGYQISNFEPYPIGGGRHEESPNGKYDASAMNMTDRINGTVVDYYEFGIVRKSDEVRLKLLKIFDEEQSIQFRQGNGRIYWDDDSKRVRFGTEDHTLWEFTIAEP